MAAEVLGLIDWHLQRDDKGYRDYTAVWKVETTDYLDGPSTILGATGLPAVGSPWEFGNDVDDWCFCWPDVKVSTMLSDEPNNWWRVEQKFSNRPLSRCETTTIDNPLSEPMDIGGSFVSQTLEAMLDKDNRPVLSSSKEVMRGSLVEKDVSKPTVNIGFNSTDLPLYLFSSMIQTVNDATLWGLPARCVKFSNCTWRRLLYGVCTFYYRIDYEFQIDFNTFDKTGLDMGTRVLAAGGTSTDPRAYQAYRNPTDDEKSAVILNGSGAAWDGTGAPGIVTARLYPSANMFLLGVPSTLA